MFSSFFTFYVKRRSCSRSAQYGIGTKFSHSAKDSNYIEHEATQSVGDKALIIVNKFYLYYVLDGHSKFK